MITGGIFTISIQLLTLQFSNYCTKRKISSRYRLQVNVHPD